MNTQNNTRPAGPFQILAGEDLTDLEGRLVKLTHDGGVPEVVLPNDVDDKPQYLLLEGGEDGEEVKVVAIDPSNAVRVRLDGTCNPGDELTLGAINGTNDGKVRTLPVAADTYYVFLRAEEAGVDEQLVLARPILNARSVVVP
jgi:hypothetical protein